jgi:hypothetical protein
MQYLAKPEILKLTRAGIGLVPLMTYKFVFAYLPCLWKTPLEKDRRQALVEAIEKKLITSRNPTAFCVFSFLRDVKTHLAW